MLLDKDCLGSARDPADTTIVYMSRSFSREAGGPATIETISAAVGKVTVLGNGLASAADTVTLGSNGYTRRVAMSRAGIVRILP